MAPIHQVGLHTCRFLGAKKQIPHKAWAIALRCVPPGVFPGRQETTPGRQETIDGITSVAAPDNSWFHPLRFDSIRFVRTSVGRGESSVKVSRSLCPFLPVDISCACSSILYINELCYLFLSHYLYVFHFVLGKSPPLSSGVGLGISLRIFVDPVFFLCAFLQFF